MYNYKITIERDQENHMTHQEQGWERSNKHQIMCNEEEAKNLVFALDQENTSSQSSDEDEINNSNLIANSNKSSNVLGLSDQEVDIENKMVSMKDICNPEIDKSCEIEMSNIRAISPGIPEVTKEKKLKMSKKRSKGKFLV